MAKLARRICEIFPDVEHVEPATINKLEKGGPKGMRLSDVWITRISRALEVNPSELLEPRQNDTIEVALVSWVAAGSFADTVDPYQPVDTPRIPAAGLKHSDYIALEVEGDSMDRIAPDGSMIFVDLRDRELRPGRDYIFRDNDRCTFKRYRDNPPRLEPFSTNPDHETVFSDGQIEVVGRVIRVVVDLMDK